ncbi:MAG TPA: hypothetical protein VGJ17_07730 [Candidatus Limnocylindrales bacterium]
MAGSAAALLFAVAGLLPLTAGVVQAHDPEAFLACNDATPSVPVLSISVTDYDPTFTNTVEASIDGVEVLATTTFGVDYTGSFPGGDPFAAHTAVVKVHTNEDNEGTQGFTKTFNLSVDPCQTATPTPPSTPPSTAPSSSPSGGVEAATATPPATATVDASAPTGTSSGFGFLMILFAVVALVVGFSPVGNRRKVNATSTTRRRR